MGMPDASTQTITNIFKDLRVRKGLSHVDLARQAFVSKQALIRLEQGTFHEPLPSVVDYWVKQGHSELVLTDAYEEFQQLTRGQNLLFLGPTLDVDVKLTTHPFEQIRRRTGINKTQVAKKLCMPQSTLQRWETNWRNQKTMPRALQETLMAVGYTREQVHGLNLAVEQWRINMKSRGETLVR